MKFKSDHDIIQLMQLVAESIPYQQQLNENLNIRLIYQRRSIQRLQSAVFILLITVVVLIGCVAYLLLR